MGKSMITVGLDIGSITTKAALFIDGRVAGTIISNTGYNAESAGKRIFEELLAEQNIPVTAVDKIVSTGYGRNSIKFAHKSVTEIICHGTGAYFLNNKTRTVIDVGGQDSKVISVSDTGKIKEFAMNEKCAAGTGRFLEVMAHALEADIKNLGSLSLKAGKPASISNICTVFAESEVISLIAKGEIRENIIAGIHEAVASRVAALAQRVGLSQVVMMTGGVAHNAGVVKALSQKLGVHVEVSEFAQVNGAIGAAIMAGQI